MNRRDFFGKMIGGVAAAAAVRAWPFRVYSFPNTIAAPTEELTNLVNGSRIIRGMINPRAMALLNAQLRHLPKSVDYNIRAFAFDHEGYLRAHPGFDLRVTRP
jgi:hypothetical protein